MSTEKIKATRQVNVTDLLGLVYTNGSTITSVKCNFNAGTPPTGGDDFTTGGYTYGSIWTYESNAYICTGDGVWFRFTREGSDDIVNESTVSGSSVSDALETLEAAMGGGGSMSFEALSGTKNNSNKVFSFASDPGSTHMVLYNGLLLHRGVDYTRDEEEITLSSGQEAPDTEDTLVGITFSAVSLVASSSDEITNTSGVSGPTVTAALNSLDSSKQATATSLSHIAALNPSGNGNKIYGVNSAGDGAEFKEGLLVPTSGAADGKFFGHSGGAPAWMPGVCFASISRRQDTDSQQYVQSNAQLIGVRNRTYGNISATNGTITISDAGVYLVQFFAGGYWSSGSYDVKFQIEIAGILQEWGSANCYIASATEGRPAVAGGAAFNLNASDTVRIYTMVGSVDWYCQHFNLDVVRIG